MAQQLIKITAYVRTDEDLAKWQALPNKTDWLHDALNATVIQGSK